MQMATTQPMPGIRGEMSVRGVYAPTHTHFANISDSSPSRYCKCIMITTSRSKKVRSGGPNLRSIPVVFDHPIRRLFWYSLPSRIYVQIKKRAWAGVPGTFAIDQAHRPTRRFIPSEIPRLERWRSESLHIYPALTQSLWPWRSCGYYLLIYPERSYRLAFRLLLRGR
jgi:hypothetical protein